MDPSTDSHVDRLLTQDVIDKARLEVKSAVEEKINGLDLGDLFETNGWATSMDDITGKQD